jgi:stage II sporulation protein M
MTVISIIRKTLLEHIRNNSKVFFTLAIAFIIGVSAGAFAVNGLSTAQNEELRNYIGGFFQLYQNQSIDNNELFKISLSENIKQIILLWILGVTIIGIPFIFLMIGIRGFITGFTSGFLFEALGLKGVLFSVLALMPREIIFIPCFIALGVSGVNFSLNIIKTKSAKHLSKVNLKSSLLAYSAVTLFYSGLILIGILAEAYVSPFLIRIISPFITN